MNEPQCGDCEHNVRARPAQSSTNDFIDIHTLPDPLTITSFYSPPRPPNSQEMTEIIVTSPPLQTYSLQTHSCRKLTVVLLHTCEFKVVHYK